MNGPSARRYASNAPTWLGVMKVGRWYRLSGDRPDLGLPATRVGTRYLRDGDPACDLALNPARRPLRRLTGRYVHAPSTGRVGFSAITEAWNGAVLATRFGDAGSLIVFGGGHNNYYYSAQDRAAAHHRYTTGVELVGAYDRRVGVRAAPAVSWTQLQMPEPLPGIQTTGDTPSGGSASRVGVRSTWHC